MQIGEVVVYGDEVLINKPGRKWESAYFQGFHDYTITDETPHKFRRPLPTAKQLHFDLCP